MESLALSGRTSLGGIFSDKITSKRWLMISVSILYRHDVTYEFNLTWFRSIVSRTIYFGISCNGVLISSAKRCDSTRRRRHKPSNELEHVEV